MEVLDIKLLGKEYQISCLPGDKDKLLEAVAYLDERIVELREKTGAAGERLAIMTAFYLANDIIRNQSGEGFDMLAAKRKIEVIKARLDRVLAQQEKLF